MTKGFALSARVNASRDERIRGSGTRKRTEGKAVGTNDIFLTIVDTGFESKEASRDEGIRVFRTHKRLETERIHVSGTRKRTGSKAVGTLEIISVAEGSRDERIRVIGTRKRKETERIRVFAKRKRTVSKAVGTLEIFLTIVDTGFESAEASRDEGIRVFGTYKREETERIHVLGTRKRTGSKAVGTIEIILSVADLGFESAEA